MSKRRLEDLMHNIHRLLIQVRVYPFTLFPFLGYYCYCLFFSTEVQHGLRVHPSQDKNKVNPRRSSDGGGRGKAPEELLRTWEADL